MTRFARHCLYALNNALDSLTNELGPGTEDLAMRFGIHSGSVTAGVLRGEKSRFQLFGDTVNTGKSFAVEFGDALNCLASLLDNCFAAARMESTGSPHKIQVSQQVR